MLLSVGKPVMVCDVDVPILCEKYDPGAAVVPASSQYWVTPVPADQVNACDEAENVAPAAGEVMAGVPPPPPLEAV